MDGFKASDEISRLAVFCKSGYDDADLLQHNWDHIVRDIYRAEQIAETEEEVDMKVLYAALMLHDIGVIIGEYKDHDENSRKLAEEKLPDFGFSSKDVEKIISVLEEFAGIKDIESIEAKILSDADKLEKSSLASIGNFFKVHMEWDKDPKKAADDLSRYRKWRDEGFYTRKAEQINNGGIQKRIDFLEKFGSALEEREDFTVEEDDLELEIKD